MSFPSARCRLSSKDVFRGAPAHHSAKNVKFICRVEAPASNSASVATTAASESEATASTPPPSAAVSAAAVSASNEATTTIIQLDKARVQAVAAKISAARNLARRLAEEKHAAAAVASSAATDTLEEAEKAKKAVQEASAAAAAQAARADALARAMRKVDSVKNQVTMVHKLRAENQALKGMLLELIGDKDVAQKKMADLEAQISTIFVSSPRGPSEEHLNTLVQEQALIFAEAMAPPPPPPAPAPQIIDISNEPEHIKDLAIMAIRAAVPIFTVPIGTASVNTSVRIYYNRNKGPLPKGSELTLKVGFNKWESTSFFEMTRDEALNEMVPGEEWWIGSILIPDDVFKMEYLVMDARSSLLDNVGCKGFQLEVVGGPTEAELLARRAAEYEIAEKARRASLDAEERRIRDRVQQQMLEAVTAARLASRDRRDSELLTQAEALVKEKRTPSLLNLPAADSREGIYQWAANQPRAGTTSILLYNRVYGPLAAGDSVRAHVGYDGWYQQEKQVVDMVKLTYAEMERHNLRTMGAEWWAAGVDVPASALVMNFVLSDRSERLWDNNKGKDYHSLIAGALPNDALTQLLFRKLKDEHAVEDKDAEDRLAKRMMRKAETKAEALRKRRMTQQEFLYCLPFNPKAGESADVFYNPDLTVLRGRPEIFLRGGWNRWRHHDRFGPLKLSPAMPGGIGFVKARLQVPKDSWTLDLVFSDTSSNQGGFYDSNGGLDYHLPVENSSVMKPALKIVHIAVEMAPIAKVGGMGDVVTALGRAVMEEGHDVEVIIPKYDCINYTEVKSLRQEADFHFNGTVVKVWKGLVEDLPTTFLEPNNGMFWVGCIYGRNDDAARFAFFCGAALAYLKQCNVRPNIVHCHDWQTAPIAWGDRGSARCIFTIHNLNYGADLVGRAMASCEVATTVSPTYAREVSGSGAVAPHLGKLFGIRNGIDNDIWDPSEDRFLPLTFTSENVVEGKAAARRALRERMKLSHTDVPVIGCVTRLVAQKGIHLIKHAAWRTLERGGQFVLLGSAPDPKVQAEFNAMREQLMKQYPDRACLWFAYDEPLSHLIYAGSDMFLVPSMFEPCGLTQMISMAYGTIPVVRKTGGLNDTVFDVDHDEERAAAAGLEVNGFSFEGTDASGMDYALNRALSAWYNDRPWWNELTRRVMLQDWSWTSPALDYIELYYKSLKT